MRSNISKTINNYKEELFENLKNKEYRKAFVESHINNSIAFQIRTMRGNLKQEDLAKIDGLKKQQPAISRMENPNYGKFTVKTLKEIASAFDVALMIKFVPFGDLIKWDLNLSSEALEVPSFEKDPYFQKYNEDIEITASHKESAIEETTSNIINMKDYVRKIDFSIPYYEKIDEDIASA